MSIPIDIGPLADKILHGVIDEAKGAWEKLTEADRELIAACTLDAAKVTVMSLSDPESARIAKKSVDAQLGNIKVGLAAAATEAASAIVWRVVATILEVAVPILVKSVLKI